jgi:ADP-ribose pyrophosphatase YjhB (NUDIX family)
MLSEFLGAIWRHLPRVIRRNAGTLTQTHYTVTVGGLIFDDTGRILLLEHVFRSDAGWGIPGGFLSHGEHPDEALRRELREEISVELEDVNVMFTRTLGQPRQVEIYFRARMVGNPRPSSIEIKRAEWFPLDKLPPDLPGDQRRLIERAVSLNENS